MPRDLTFTDQLNGPTPATTSLATIDVDGAGVGRAVVDWPREQRVEFGLRVARDGWTSVAEQWQLRDRAFARDGDAVLIRGQLDAGGSSVALVQRVGPTSVRYELTAIDAIDDLAGLFWRFAVPADAFAGGVVRVGDSAIPLPADIGEHILGDAAADRVAFLSPDARRSVTLRFDRPLHVSLHDARAHGTPQFTLQATPHAGPIAAGERVAFDVALSATVPPVARDAAVSIDASRRLNAFDGTGGNFVFSLDDPTTDLVLREMRPAWARVGLDGREWYGDIAAADVDGSPLRTRCELARRLGAIVGDGRLICSTWYPPERLFAEPTTNRGHAGTIPRERWLALADVVVAYLRHLRSRYGVAPALFSFNESDLGVYLRLDAAETRALTILLGERFRDAGLATRLLLGDSSDLAAGLAQIGPTLADDRARPFVGALGHHPWNDQRAEWPRWAELAERHGLPLLATEVGVDFDGYQLGSYNAPLSTLRLARRYVALIREARARALLEWEWTGNYAMAERRADGTLALSPRGELLRQFNRATPAEAQVVATTCDDPAIDAVALVGAGGRVTVHLVNSDVERVVRIAGLPTTPMTLAIVDARSGDRATSRVEVIDGACSIVAPAGSLATLSNVE